MARIAGVDLPREKRIEIGLYQEKNVLKSALPIFMVSADQAQTRFLRRQM